MIVRLSLLVILLLTSSRSSASSFTDHILCDFRGNIDPPYEITLHYREWSEDWAEVYADGWSMQLRSISVGEVVHLFDDRERPDFWVLSINPETMEALARYDQHIVSSEECWRE